jgi:predicted alpha/beta hydrolase
MSARLDVEFPAHDGITLRGWLYTPGNVADVPGPAVVMAHGFSATRGMALDRYAEVFADGGLTVLVYDHRGLGASDGEPRQVVGAWIRRDCRAAITWLGARDNVDVAHWYLGFELRGQGALVVQPLTVVSEPWLPTCRGQDRRASTTRRARPGDA